MLKTEISSEFKKRRDRIAKLPESEGAVFIFAALPEFLRNNDVSYAHRQESNFRYLTGFEEPESYAVLRRAKTGSAMELTLFVRTRDLERELWEGERYGVEGTKDVFAADHVYPHHEFKSVVTGYLKDAAKIYYKFGVPGFKSEDDLVLNLLEENRRNFGRSGRGILPIMDPTILVGEMRIFKSKHEIASLRQACELSAQAHIDTLKYVRPGMNESEVEGFIYYQFRKNGGERLGYDSIIAGGKNACCLHYRANNEVLKDGELLLIDAGAEYDYYTADITRTFPVGKNFSREQAALYDLVLSAQLAALKKIRPGETLPAIHETAFTTLTEGLLKLGLLKGSLEQNLKLQNYKRFYPHGTGHLLGMDVHDTGLYQIDGKPRALEVGMCFTVEPGLYVQTHDREAPVEYRGIGIRIEDDVVVTENGAEILTKDAPKTRAAIEALRSSHGSPN